MEQRGVLGSREAPSALCRRGLASCWAIVRAAILAAVLAPGVLAQASATASSLRGRVLDRADSTALVGATVALAPEFVRGTATGPTGAFTLPVPHRRVAIRVSYVGYAPVTVETEAGARVTVYLDRTEVVAGHVTVEGGRRSLDPESPRMSRVSLTAADVASTPQVFGEPDVLKTAHLMPGVQGGTEGSAGLYVRGGGADQNLVLVDGLPVYGTTHLFGFFSAFPTEAVAGVDVYKGGFPARYSGRLSSVVDVAPRSGTRERRRGSVALGVVGAQGHAEGPAGAASVLVAGRRTVVDIATRAVGADLHPSFGDVYARYARPLGAGELLVSGYGSRDAYTGARRSGLSDGASEDYGLTWSNALVAGRWIRPGASPVEVGAGVVRYRLGAWQRVSADAGQPASSEYGSSVTDFRSWAHAERDWGRWGRTNGGAAVSVRRFAVAGFRDAATPDPVWAGEAGVYAEHDVSAGPFRTVVGGRASVYGVDGTRFVAVEPRVSGRLRMPGGTSLKASYARTWQPAHGLPSTVGGLPVDAWFPATPSAPPSTADQVAVGVSLPSGSTYSVSVEAFDKKSSGLVSFRDGEGLEDAVTRAWEDVVVRGTGRARGVEVFVERRGRLSGWLGYTLSRTTRSFPGLDGGRPFPARYDRRHDVSLVASFAYGPRTTFSAVWVYGTGEAATLPNGSYVVCSGTSVGFPSADECGYAISYGDRNGSRLPPYHRLDVAYRFERAAARFAFVAGAYNVYNRMNAFSVRADGVDVREDGTLAGTGGLDVRTVFPFLPYVRFEVGL